MSYVLTDRGKRQMGHLEDRVFAGLGDNDKWSEWHREWRKDFLTSLYQVEETGEAYSPRKPYLDIQSFLVREGYIREI